MYKLDQINKELRTLNDKNLKNEIETLPTG